MYNMIYENKYKYRRCRPSWRYSGPPAAGLSMFLPPAPSFACRPPHYVTYSAAANGTAPRWEFKEFRDQILD